MRITKEDFILPAFLLVLGLGFLVIAISREGLSGAMILSMGIGALCSLGMWLSARQTTFKRDALQKHRGEVSKKVNITLLLVFVVILISIGNSILRFSFDTDGRLIIGAFIAVCLLGMSFTQAWELWYDWTKYKDS